MPTILSVRTLHHQKYQESRLQNENLNAAADSVTSLYNSNSENRPKHTVLIAGDSMISGNDERQLSSKQQVRVRFFPGASLERTGTITSKRYCKKCLEQ